MTVVAPVSVINVKILVTNVTIDQLQCQVIVYFLAEMNCVIVLVMSFIIVLLTSDY